MAAAAELFTENGYASTTVEAVSERSGVPASTVYRLFASKIGILKAWLDTSIGGDEAPVAVVDRPQVADLTKETDPREVIAGFAAVTAAINTRSNSVYRILSSAAQTDAEARVLFTEMQRQRATGQRRLTKNLARLGALRDGLGERRASDIVHAIMSPETYALLVVDRRWSARRYRDWLCTTLCQQLL